MTNLNDFEASYLDSFMWSSTGDDYDFDSLSFEDCSAELLAEVKADCEKFLSLCADTPYLDGEDYDQVAHDFILTRNHHGAGFWDGDYPKHGDALTELVHNNFREVWLYIGDDGLVYQM